MSDTPSIRKNFAYSTIYQIISVMMPFITTPYLSRVLGSDMIGIQSYTESVQTYFLLFAGLGTSVYGTREIAQHRNDIRERSRLFWEIELLSIFTSTASLAAWVFLITVTSKYQIYYIAMIPHLLASMLDISWFYRGLEKFQLPVTRNIVFLFLELIVILLFVKTKTDFLVYIIILSSVKLFTSISLWGYLRQYTIQVDFRTLKIRHHLKQTLCYFIPTIATSIYTILDRTLLGLLTADNAQNGYYFQAEKIINVAKSVSSTAINSVVGVRISYLLAEKKLDEVRQRIHHSVNYILFAGIGSACGIITIAHSFVPLFFGDDFVNVEYLLYILCPLILITGISNCLGSHYYTPTGKRVQSTKYLIAGSAVNLMLNLIFIPAFHAFGAATASVLAELVISILYIANSDGYLTRRQLIQSGWKKMLAGIVTTAFVCPIGYQVQWTNRLSLLGLQIILYVVVYLSVLFVLKDKWTISYTQKFIQKMRRNEND